MLHTRSRLLVVAILSLGALAAAGCGSGGGDSFSDAAHGSDATAVSANPVGAGKGVSKVDPVVRRGVESPQDSATDVVADSPAPGNGAIPSQATRLFATRFESGVDLTEATGFRNEDRYLVGSDIAGYAFPADFWSAPARWRSWVLSTVGEVTHEPVTDFLSATIKPVIGRDGALTRALSLHSKAPSRGGGAQAIYVQNVGMAAEAVVYQRMWVKFDAAMLSRAQSAGSAGFEQTFWEATARPDYRIRLNVRYDDAIGLYWNARADRVDGGSDAWAAALRSVPVVLASAEHAAGWHAVEIWMDRPGGRFAAAIDGTMLVDQRGDLTGASGNKVDVLRMMMVHSAAAPLAEVLFDDLELWDAPPEGATILR